MIWLLSNVNTTRCFYSTGGFLKSIFAPIKDKWKHLIWILGFSEWRQNSNKIYSDFPVRSAAFQPRQLCYCHLSLLVVGRAGCRCLSLRWPSETVHLTFTLPDNIVHSITSCRNTPSLTCDVMTIWLTHPSDIFTAWPHDIFSLWLLQAWLRVDHGHLMCHQP